MRSVLNAKDRKRLVIRFEQLSPEHAQLWGEMNVGQMVCHVGDQLQVALGDIPVKQIGNLVMHTLVKWLIIYTPISVPKGKVQTVPEMQITKPMDLAKDVNHVKMLLERSSKKAPGSRWGDHPAFGEMTGKQWGIVAYKHTDYHLRQFGA